MKSLLSDIGFLYPNNIEIFYQFKSFDKQEVFPVMQKYQAWHIDQLLLFLKNDNMVINPEPIKMHISEILKIIFLRNLKLK